MPMGGQYSRADSLRFCPGPEGRVRWTSVRVDCVAKPIEQPAYFAALHKSESGRFCSLIPGLGVKLFSDRPCRAHCSLRGRGEPSA
jgi:hypothetical protein